MALLRMDHVGVVVDDLDAAVAFFAELGMEVEARMPVEGAWVDQVVGLDGVWVEIAMMRTPDGHGKLELTEFLSPDLVATEPEVPPPNTLGLRRLMFAVDDIEDTVARLRTHGAELVGQVADFENVYRLCYLRGPGAVIVALAERIG
jgi:catechol 2,3-dioxygenase-like lactoylglutathione lyase family enzyme